MADIINHSLPIQKAVTLAKKAATSKFTMMKDEGNTFTVGAPMMTATVVVTESTIEVEGKGGGKMVATTVSSEIKLAIEDAMNNTSSSSAGNASTPAEEPTVDGYVGGSAFPVGTIIKCENNLLLFVTPDNQAAVITKDMVKCSTVLAIGDIERNQPGVKYLVVFKDGKQAVLSVFANKNQYKVEQVLF